MGKNKKVYGVLALLVAVLFLGIGYATISDINLSISGTASGKKGEPTFKVEFTNAASSEQKIGTGTVTASIDAEDSTKGNITVTDLQNEGDYVRAVFTITNQSKEKLASLGAPTLTVTDSEGQTSNMFKLTYSYSKTPTIRAKDTIDLTITITALEDFQEDTTHNISVSINATPLDYDADLDDNGNSDVNFDFDDEVDDEI